MLKNGGLLLEKRISYFGRYSNPIRNFSIQEIQKATENFNGNLIFNHDVGYYYKWRKGSLEGRVICIRTIFPSFPAHVQTVINEIAVATQMSSHKNVLKLLGCCLRHEYLFWFMNSHLVNPLQRKYLTAMSLSH